MAPRIYHPFPETHWSIVRRAGSDDGAVRREALATLLARYEPALLSFLCNVRHLEEDEARDILQEFIASKVLAYQLFQRAQEQAGRFRQFLMTSLSHFVIDCFRKDQAFRSKIKHKAEDFGIKPTPTAWNIVEAAWARSLVHEVLANMKAECIRTGRDDVWQVFEKRILSELFSDGQPMPYEELALHLKTGSPTQTANLLVTAKRMYARLLRAAVAEYEKNNAEIDSEIQELCRALQVPEIE